MKQLHQKKFVLPIERCEAIVMMPQRWECDVSERGHNPFLKAWGEVDAWKGSQHQAMTLSLLPPSLVLMESHAVMLITQSIGQSYALRQHIITAIDQLVPQLHCVFLGRAMRSLRSSRKGFKRIRRHSIDRAASLEGVVEEEHKKLFAARLQMDAWSRAIDHALILVGQEVSPPVSVQSESHDKATPDAIAAWAGLQERLDQEHKSLLHLQESILFLTKGTEVLRSKAEKFLEVCRTLPEHEDVLQSKILNEMINTLVAVPNSELPYSRE